MPRASQNREAGFWRLISDALKKSGRKIEATRIESWAVPGVPDVVFCSEDGNFSFLELKAAKAHGPLALSPHQVSWLTRHGHSQNCFVVLWAPVLLDNSYAGRSDLSTRMGIHLYIGGSFPITNIRTRRRMAPTMDIKGVRGMWLEDFITRWVQRLADWFDEQDRKDRQKEE